MFHRPLEQFQVYAQQASQTICRWLDYSMMLLSSLYDIGNQKFEVFDLIFDFVEWIDEPRVLSFGDVIM